MKSMTGFGRGEWEENGHQFTVEIKTVNHRYLECSIRMPHELNALEANVRQKIKEAISRGKTDVSIRYRNHSEEQGNIWINEVILKQYVEALKNSADELGLENDLKLSNIVTLPGIFETEADKKDLEVIYPMMEKALCLALDDLNRMRQREGDALQADFGLKLDELEENVVKITELAPTVVAGYKEKLYARIQEHLDKSKLPQLDDGRLEVEVTMFSDRCCIDEEITRLLSHIRQYRQIIAKQEPVGRQLDFLTQELNRESNTIASKSNDLTITRHALAMKNIIEKLREQIQNIE